MMNDHKKIASVIMGKIGPESSYAEGGEVDGKDAAAEEIMSAIESKDSAALASALHSFIEICSGMGEEDEGEAY